MTRICYYISGHGFGHATRAAQLTYALLSLDIDVTICTLAPRHLFPDHAALTYRAIEVDSSIVQPLPYEIDVDASFKSLQTFIGTHKTRLSDRVARETQFVKDGGYDLILSDAPWSVGLLTIPVPRVIVSNFTFDLIFKDLLQHLPPDTEQHIKQEYEDLVRDITRAYHGFTHLIRLPGYIDFPFLKNSTATVLDAALIFRPPRCTREETLTTLRIPREYHNHRILLVQFGGHLVSASDMAPSLPDGWICLLATPIADSRFFTFDPSIYLPDLVAASDAVLGKIGYGTVSECVGMAKPLLYVARDMFAEEPYLLQYMRINGTCLELDRTEFESGEWSRAIEQVSSMVSNKPCAPLEDGSLSLAKSIIELIG